MTTFRNVSTALPHLAHKLLTEGEDVGTRQGGRVQELLHQEITLSRPWEREILTHGRRASLPAQIAETVWILTGRNDVQWLEAYLPRAGEFSDDGKVWRGGYGPRLRAWQRRDRGDVLDQLAYVLDLLREDPLSRRAVMSIYDPDADSIQSKDIPCNNWLSFQSRLGKLHMHVATRSNDLVWGWSGINAFEWSALQEIMAGILGINPGPLHFSISSLHAYERHYGRLNTLSRAPEPSSRDWSKSPRFDGSQVQSVDELDSLLDEWMTHEQDIRAGRATPESVLEFPEPMLRSWLLVLGHYWAPDEGASWLAAMGDGSSSLEAAALASPRPKREHLEAHRALGAEPENLDWRDKLIDTSDYIPAEVLDAGGPFRPRAQGPADLLGHNRGEDLPPLPSAPQTADFEPAGWWATVDADHEKFLVDTFELHAAKHEAYGDSWKRRGEALGIMANIARKVDRLGKTDDHETAADTAVDLMVYLAKYRVWLADHDSYPLDEILRANTDLPGELSDHIEPVEDVLTYITQLPDGDLSADMAKSQEFLEYSLTQGFDHLELAVMGGPTAAPDKLEALLAMLKPAQVLAYQMWQTGRE